MQNPKNYQNFSEEHEYTGGIPVGQPVQYELQQMSPQQQAPYFQQPNNNPYQGNNQYPNMMQPTQPVFNMNQQAPGPMILQP